MDIFLLFVLHDAVLKAADTRCGGYIHRAMTILCPLKRLPQIAFGVQLGGVGATPAKQQVEEKHTSAAV